MPIHDGSRYTAVIADDHALIRAGLSAALAIFLAMALARLVGFAVDGPQTWLSIALLAAEASGAAVAAVALRASDRDVA